MAEPYESIGDQNLPVQRKTKISAPGQEGEPSPAETSSSKVTIDEISTKFKEDMIKLDQRFVASVASKSIDPMGLVKHEAAKYRTTTEFLQKASEDLTSELETTCKHAMDALHDLQLQTELTQKFQKEAELARAEAVKYKAECEVLRAANVKLGTNTMVSKRSNSDLLRALRGDLDQQTSEAEILRKKLKELELLYDYELQEKNMIVKRGDELNQECAELRESERGLRGELEIVSDQVTQLNNELLKTKDLKSRLLIKIFTKHDQLDQMHRDLEHKTAELENLNEQMTLKNQTLEAFKTDLESKQREIEDLHLELNPKKFETMQLKMDVESKEMLVAMLRKNLKSQKSENAKLRAKLDSKCGKEAPEPNTNLTAATEEIDQSRNTNAAVSSTKSDRVFRLETNVEAHALEMSMLKLEMEKVHNEINLRETPAAPKPKRVRKQKLCSYL